MNDRHPSDISATRLHEARERAVRRVEASRAELDAIIAASDSANLDDEHDPEGATVGFERAQVSSLLERARTQLDETDAALERLQRGTYGICESCGRAIPDERLAAQPASTRCVTCTVG